MIHRYVTRESRGYFLAWLAEERRAEFMDLRHEHKTIFSHPRRILRRQTSSLTISQYNFCKTHCPSCIRYDEQMRPDFIIRDISSRTFLLTCDIVKLAQESRKSVPPNETLYFPSDVANLKFSLVM